MGIFPDTQGQLTPQSLVRSGEISNSSDGLGAKIKKNRSVAPPRKKNSIATMHQVYISGAWKTMFDYFICGQFFIIDL